MAELPPRKSALAAVYITAASAGGEPGGAGVVLWERRPLHLFHISGPPGNADFLAAVRERAGVAPPLAANTVARDGATTMLWLAPDRWLLVTPEPAAGDRESGLKPGDFAQFSAAVTDVGHGRTVIRAEGPAVRDLLAKGCTLDFHPRSFPPGTCAQSILGAINVLVHALPDGDAFEIFVARGFAVALWEWLTDAATEFGYRVDPAAPS